jgi:hypothetical protein
MKNSDESRTLAPCFSFFPADWLNDIKLQSCSLKAQGLLINLMCLMHQSTRYGHLLVNGSKPPDSTVSHLLRLHPRTYHASLEELKANGVLSQDENGVIYSKRMIKDEYIRKIRRESGKLGGSPLLKQEVKVGSNQKPTPSISSSVSVSSSVKATPPDLKTEEQTDIKKAPVFKKIKELMLKFPDMRYQHNIQEFLKANWNKNDDAILHCLNQLMDSNKPVPYPKAFMEKILSIENGNFNEREFQSEHQKHKEPIPINEIAGLGDVLKTMGGRL